MHGTITTTTTKKGFIFDYRTVSSQDLYTLTDPNTAGYSEHIRILPTYIITSRSQ
jgi:hypothetical protein